MPKLLEIAAIALVAAGDSSAGPDPKATYARLLCGARAGCSIADVHRVGPDDGQPQVVVEVLTEAPDPTAAFPGCTPAEYWLVTGRPDKPTRHQLLASGLSGTCAAVGDTATIRAKTFTFVDSSGGGHPDHFEHASTVDLGPLGLEEEHGSDAARFPNTNVVEYDWKWTTFSGSGSGRYLKCGGEVDPGSDALPAGPLVHWATLPALEARPAGIVHLGACAASIGPSRGGFTIAGKRDRTDSSFRAVIAGHELLVEVTDDHWTADDHVEVWLARERAAQQLDQCEDNHPSEKLPVARVPAAAKDGVPALLTITLPDWFDPRTSGITVAYNDADPGKPLRRIATSELAGTERWRLGRVRTIAPAEATCQVRGGTLEPVMNRSFKPDEPLIGAP